MIMCYITLDLIPIATLSSTCIILEQSFFRSKYRKPSNHATSGVNSSELGGRIGPKGIPAGEDNWVYLTLKFHKRPLNITPTVAGHQVRLPPLSLSLQNSTFYFKLNFQFCSKNLVHFKFLLSSFLLNLNHSFGIWPDAQIQLC